MQGVRSKLTYANVISTLCLVLVLAGGTAYAASHLGKNTVGTKQLKDGAVTQTKIDAAAQAALRGQTGSRGATGPQGPTGMQGVQGLTGLSGYEQKTAVTMNAVNLNDQITRTVDCPTGKVPLGGGQRTVGLDVRMVNSQPTATGWSVTLNAQGTGTATTTVWVTCAKVG